MPVVPYLVTSDVGASSLLLVPEVRPASSVYDDEVSGSTE